MYNDPITELELPVEDVFVSNVDAWFGNVRLFEGRWQSNAEYVRAGVETLLRVQKRPWVSQTLRHAMALLRVSEAVAERAQVARYTRTASKPGQKTAVGVSTVTESTDRVVFGDEELIAIGVEPAALDPFIIQSEHANLLFGQSLGHSVLERRPLVRFKGRTTVVLPTAIGAAIRRFVLERASAAGDLRLFQSTCHLAQFTEVFLLGRADWDIGFTEMLEPDPNDGMREFVGTFDKGGYVHPHASPYFCRHQITPKTSRYTRCSMSMLPNVSINRRTRSSGQLGRWWYSISPCRNNECVRRFTVFAFNQRS